MELTAEQRAVVEDDALARLVIGGFASGKTTALVHRWRRLAEEHGAGSVIVVAGSSLAVPDVRRRMMVLADGLTVGPLSVTTWTGLAVDVARRSVPELAEATILGGDAQRRFINELFAEERKELATNWGAEAVTASRRAFPDRLVAAVRAVRASRLTPGDLLARAEAADASDRWASLLRFVERYEARLRARNAVDFAGVVRAAEPLLAASVSDRFVEILLDDVHSLDEAHRGLAEAAVNSGVAVTAAAVDGSDLLAGARTIAVDYEHRSDERLVVCRHPSIEADAIVGELAAAHEDGVGWHEMAVVTPRAGAPIARAVVRALSRRSIPVRIRLADGEAEPVVRRVRDLLASADKAETATAAFERALFAAMDELMQHEGVDLAAPEPSLDRALDALVAYARGVAAWVDQQLPGDANAGTLLETLSHNDLLEPATADDDGSVAVVSADQATGRHWRFAVLTSCVEGEYPRLASNIGWFDDALTRSAPPQDLGARRRLLVADERRRFAVAASRAERVAYVTAPQPGVLVSRYVEHLPARDPRPGWVTPSNPLPKSPTVTTVPITPSGALRLSASQLNTYEDCPRRWFYDSVLRLSDSTSVWAEFGNLVHDVLEKFLAPNSTIEYSLDALLDLAEEMWTDDLAQFAPQRTQARRELREVLENWWTMEGSRFDRSQVVDVEHEFDVAVGAHTVRGFIDRVDHDPDRGGIAVVDYKTGRKPPSDAEVDEDLQLAVYYLAAVRSPQLAAFGPPTRLELKYLRSSKTLTQAITADHEQRAEARIMAAAQLMLDEQLEPLPTADCDHCDYHRLCPLQRAGRESGARR